MRTLALILLAAVAAFPSVAESRDGMAGSHYRRSDGSDPRFPLEAISVSYDMRKNRSKVSGKVHNATGIDLQSILLELEFFDDGGHPMGSCQLAFVGFPADGYKFISGTVKNADLTMWDSCSVRLVDSRDRLDGHDWDRRRNSDKGRPSPQSDPRFPVDNISVNYIFGESRIEGTVINRGRDDLAAATFKLVFYDSNNRPLGSAELAVRDFHRGEAKAFAATVARTDLRNWRSHTLHVVSSTDRRHDKERREPGPPPGFREFTLEDVSVNYSMGRSTVSGKIRNNTRQRIMMSRFSITFFDEARRPIGTADITATPMDPNQATSFHAPFVQGDVRNWGDYIISKK